MSLSQNDVEGIKRTVMLRLPGTTPTLVDQEFHWVVSEFLGATRCFRRIVPVVLVADVYDYGLSIADEESVVVLLSARYNGDSKLTMGTPVYADDTMGFPVYASLMTDRELRIFPKPSPDAEGKTVEAHVALTLLPTSFLPEAGEGLPPVLAYPDELRPYQGYLLDGALARMMGMADKPWTNTRLAETHLRRFENGKTMVRREMDAQRTYTSLTMRGPRFGA